MLPRLNWLRGFHRLFFICAAIWMAVAFIAITAKGVSRKSAEATALHAKPEIEKKLVDVPGFGTIEFPGEMSDRDIREVLDRELPKHGVKPDVFDIAAVEIAAEKRSSDRRLAEVAKLDAQATYTRQAVDAFSNRDCPLPSPPYFCHLELPMFS